MDQAKQFAQTEQDSHAAILRSAISFFDPKRYRTSELLASLKRIKCTHVTDTDLVMEKEPLLTPFIEETPCLPVEPGKKKKKCFVEEESLCNQRENAFEDESAWRNSPDGQEEPAPEDPKERP